MAVPCKTIEIREGRHVRIFLDPVMSPPLSHDAPLVNNYQDGEATDKSKLFSPPAFLIQLPLSLFEDSPKLESLLPPFDTYK
ncbi:hypothetical protein LXL04_002225 [Taraxacum kok-saghyz]